MDKPKDKAKEKPNATQNHVENPQQFNHDSTVVQKYIQATDELAAITEELKSTRGELRRTIATLRDALKGALDSDCSQLSLPHLAAGSTSDGQPTSQQSMFVRRMTYRSAKTITTPVVTEAYQHVCSAQRASIDLQHPDWRRTLRDYIVDCIKERTITKQQYVDVTPKGMKKTLNPSVRHQQRSASEEHPAVPIAMELHATKERLKELNRQEAEAALKPKRRLDALTGRLKEQMSKSNTFRVRVPNTQSDQPDRFVAAKCRVRKPHLTMRVLISLLDRALGQCPSLHDITETVLRTLEQWLQENDRETEVVTIDKGGVSRSWDRSSS